MTVAGSDATAGVTVAGSDATAGVTVASPYQAAPPASGVEHFAEALVPTPHGEFLAHVYVAAGGEQHVACVMGDVEDPPPPLVRVHSECLTGDVLRSLRCDCGAQLDHALAAIAAEGRGVLLYMRGHEGRGIGIGHKIRAYALQEHGLDTVEANAAQGLPVDGRVYDAAAAILADLGLSGVRLLTNNPAKCEGLARGGIEVVERVPIETGARPENLGYLRTKRAKLGHSLSD